MTRARTRWVVALGGLALAGAAPPVACVHARAPRARLGPPAVARMEAFPYRDFEALLRERVDAQGRVDYDALRAHRAPLDRFLAAVAEAGPTRRPALFPRREDQLGYYLNAYNALTLRNVIEEWPFREIDDLRKLRFFVTTRYVVDGRETSLRSLEDDVVRGRFRDPRAHAALNCAARGCPRLPREAFWPDRLDAQLDREMRAFVSEPRSVRVDPDGRRVWLSQIFEWFEEDFVQAERARGVAQPSVITYVNRYRAPDAQIPTGLRVEHIPYDWTVNAQRLPADGIVRRDTLWPEFGAFAPSHRARAWSLLTGLQDLAPVAVYVRQRLLQAPRGAPAPLPGVNAAAAAEPRTSSRPGRTTRPAPNDPRPTDLPRVHSALRVSSGYAAGGYGPSHASTSAARAAAKATASEGALPSPSARVSAAAKVSPAP